MLIGTADAVVDCYGSINVAVPKGTAIPHDQFSANVHVKARYFGLPQGVKIRVTLEIIEEEKPK